MKKILICLLAFPFALGMTAQTKVEGEATLGAGYGETAPYMAGANLKIEANKFTIKPYLNIKGITPYNSGELTSLDFIYASSGNHYTQEQEKEQKGYKLGYGVDVQYRLDDRNIFQASVDGVHTHRRFTGERTEFLYAPDGTLLSSVQSLLSSPTLYRDEVNVQASYLHKTALKGESVLFQYNYSTDLDDDNSLQLITGATGFGPDMYTRNIITSDIFIHRHELLLDWKRPLFVGNLNVGVRYINNFINSLDGQLLDDFVYNDSEFRHRTNTVGAYAGYGLKINAIEADAQVEYNYSRMNEKNLHDVIPQARFAYHLNPQNTLTASYAMRIVRPTLQYLYDDRVKGPYTLDFGNEELEGIHINRMALAYELKTKRVDFTATVAHTNVTDGFNAIWYEIENVRVSTWGNEGVRKAIEITPEVLWRPVEGTKLRAAFTALWDERIAYAINLRNPNWGFTGRAGWEQQLPLGFKLGLDAMISKGNTVDVYSHEGLNYVFGGNLERSFLKDKLTATLGYEYKKLPVIELTQGAPQSGYTGSIYVREHNPNTVNLSLSYKF